MRKLKYIPFVLLGLIMRACSPTPQQSTQESSKPHVIFILADDLGYGDLGCYNAASKIPTPNIDQLAQAGMRFTDAHSPSAVCTPTRYGILTGRYCWRTDLKGSVAWSYDKQLIDSNRFTMPKMFREAGYRTAAFGKWHLGWDWATKPGYSLDTVPVGYKTPAQSLDIEEAIDLTKPLGGGPKRVGFDYHFGLDLPNLPPYCYIENGQILGDAPFVRLPDTLPGGRGYMKAGWNMYEVVPTISKRVIEYVQDHVATQKETPFFLYYAFTTPHTPIVPNQEFRGKSQAGDYGDLVVELDAHVGRLVDELKRLGIYDNTLIVFTSDNGSPMRASDMRRDKPEWAKYGMVKQLYGHDSSFPLKGIKSDTWEGGHRVPLIVSKPGLIPAHTQNDQLFCLTDFMATFSEMLGVSLAPVDAEDSYNLLSYLKGEEVATPLRDHVVSHSDGGDYALRKGDWKLIFSKHSGGFSTRSGLDPYVSAFEGQLYDIRADLSETTNLYGEREEIIEELTQMMAQLKQRGINNR